MPKWKRVNLLLKPRLRKTEAASARLASKRASYTSKISDLENTIASLDSDINSYGADLAEFSRLEKRVSGSA